LPQQLLFSYILLLPGAGAKEKWVSLMGVQKGIEDDVLGKKHALALDMHEIQSSIIEQWLKALSIISSFVELW